MKMINQPKSPKMSSSNTLKFGILSTANIAVKVTKAIHTSNGAEVIAVASRTQEKADKFAKENEIPTAYAQYTDLLADENVDAVYIPLPTSMKKEWALKSIEAGKHVLVEKPFPSASAVKEMVEAAASKGVQFMDGTMFVHNLRVDAIKEAIPEKLEGAVSFSSGFTIGAVGDGDIRYNPELEPMGCIGDLGWYNSKVMLVFNDWQLPKRVRAIGNSQTGVPKDCSVIMEFEDGKRYTFDCGFIGGWRMWFEIVGMKGQIIMDGFVLPWQTDAVIFPENEYREEQEYHLVLGCGQRETVQLGKCVQEVQMIEDFVDAVQKGGEEKWGEEAEVTQKLVDAIFEAFESGEVVEL
eukprot:TRINITY_DN809_c0_g1_i10.p1 TRINITY_DN809_c0_g1~~TRINITY_DN809_c0_g1_i10.p1  ORF type:complete len:352 (+),score=114.15 TRINITY_DN809_c0_g1_i10:1033-2088(+)